MTRKLAVGTSYLAFLSLISLFSNGRANAGPAAPVEAVVTGPAHQTPYTIITGLEAGPTVLLVGIGSEIRPAPAKAIEEIRAWPLLRGRLVIVSDEGKLAAEGKDPVHVSSDETEAFLRQIQPDWVVELTETEGKYALHAAVSDASRQQANSLLDAANRTLAGDAPRFVLDTSGGKIGPFASTAHTLLNIPAITIATTSTGKDQPQSLRMRQDRFVVHQLLSDLKMNDGDANLLVPSDVGGRIRVAMYDAEGSGAPGPLHMEPYFATLPDILLRRVGPADIQAGVLKQFDMLIQPGGTGHGQATALGENGRAEICKFVDNGGGFIGICAGCYLATCKYEWSLGLINAKTVDSKHWNRGRAELQIELTPLGREILGDKTGPFTCLYHGGPVLAPADDAKLSAFQPLAYYRTEAVAKGAEKGLMVGTPAMVCGTFGKGRVISISPHPEQTPGLEDFVPRAIRWTVGRPVDGAGK